MSFLRLRQAHGLYAKVQHITNVCVKCLTLWTITSMESVIYLLIFEFRESAYSLLSMYFRSRDMKCGVFVPVRINCRLHCLNTHEDFKGF